MQLMPAAVLLASLTSPALADCSVGISTPGVMSLSTGDSTVLTSEAGAASVLIVTNLSGILGTTISISNPRLDTYPGGFAAGNAVVEETYSAAWVLGSSSNSTFSSATRSFPVGIGAVVTLTLNNRVTAAGGFKQGSYSTKTTISCS
jgi:hypothetical protein